MKVEIIICDNCKSEIDGNLFSSKQITFIRDDSNAIGITIIGEWMQGEMHICNTCVLNAITKELASPEPLEEAKSE